MVDLSEREIMSKSADDNSLRTCVDCGTLKTPLWRGGPAGPKSLCNACGIRNRKKRRAIMNMGVTKEEKKIKKSSSSGKNSSHESSSSNGSSSSSGDCTSNLEQSLKSNKNRLWAFGRDVAFQRPRSNTTQRRKMGEVERAAALLMALSCGSAYA